MAFVLHGSKHDWSKGMGKTNELSLPPQDKWKAIRLAGGRTHVHGAYECECTIETFAKWEKGLQRPSNEHVELLAAFLADCQRRAKAAAKAAGK